MDRLFVKKDNVKLAYIGIAVFLLVIVIFCQSFISIAKSYREAEDTCKYFQSVEIEKGDTIWSIASQYISSEYISMDEYVNEIIELNNLKSVEIHTGEYIVVPYYGTL